MAESEPGGEIARSELRASHDDRDRVVELLRVSAKVARALLIHPGHLPYEVTAAIAERA